MPQSEFVSHETPLDLVRRQSIGEQKALSDPAAEPFQIIALSDGLDPFRNDLDGKALADMQDRLDNGAIRRRCQETRRF